MRGAAISFLLTIVVTASFGQSTSIASFFKNNERKADYYYSLRAYRNALTIYLHMADKGAVSQTVQKKIADCYVQLHNPSAAEPWYEALYKDHSATEEIKLAYAHTLAKNNKHLEALTVLHSIDKADSDSLFIEKQISFINDIKGYYHDSVAIVLKEAYDLNSPVSDFGTAYYKKNVVFASTRDYDLFIKHRSLNATSGEEALTHLFISSQKEEEFGRVSLFKKDQLMTAFHDGPVTFYDNYRRAVITRSNIVNQKAVEDTEGKVNPKLLFADVGLLGEFQNIKPFPFNQDDCSVGHATVSRRGDRMYFAANYPGGHGGSDIYYSDLVDDQWTEPVNAGAAINTAGDELYPFLQNDSTLFFSSSGHGGFGGLDVFSIRRVKGKFRRAKNVGNPINSPRDDFGFMTDSTTRNGFVSSNRLGGQGSDDIYAFHANRAFLQGETRELINPEKIIPGTAIIVRDDEGIVIDSTKSDEQGRFHLDLPFDQDMTISASKKGYAVLEDIGFSTHGDTFGVDSLTIPLWKEDLFAKGRIFDNETQAILPHATALLIDLTTNEVDSLDLDEKGNYSFLVRPNKKYRIEARKNGFIPNGFNLNTHDIYKGELLNDIVLEEIYVDKVVTLFDYDKFDVKTEWHKELNRMLRTLKKYPTYRLHIGAHADSRGSNAYNQALSEKRASAELHYFIDRGIDRSRIEAVGFGEELVLNQCSDGVECPEEDHSRNRRAELKVQKPQ